MKTVLATLVLWVFMKGCENQGITKGNQSKISLKGIWEGTVDFGSQIKLDLTEKAESIIEGQVIITNEAGTDTFQINRGVRTSKDSVEIDAVSTLGNIRLKALLEDSVMTGSYFLLVLAPPDEGFWTAQKTK